MEACDIDPLMRHPTNGVRRMNLGLDLPGSSIRRSKLLVAILCTGLLFVVSLMCLQKPLQSADRQNDGEATVEYSFDQLAQGRIIGKLGKPLGTYCTVRGKWITDMERWQDSLWFFHVTHIDDRELTTTIEYPAYTVNEVLVHGHKSLTRYTSPKEGEIWELRAYEGMSASGAPLDYVKENHTGLEQGELMFRLRSTLNYGRGKILGVPAQP
jgi:hypothetical protein